MYVVGLDEYGGPDVLHLIERPDPHPAQGQVRVKVRVAGINPVDVMVRDGSLSEWFAGAQPPFVPGMDIAGTIDELGEGIDPQLRVSIGQEAVGVVDNYGSYGGYSQFVCVPAASVIPVPSGVTSPAAAASFLMNALTARHALDALRLPVGSSLLVTGAAGAVGAYVVALAADEGLRVLAVAAPEDESFLRLAGAAVVVARGNDIAGQVRHACPEGVDAVVDTARLYAQIAPAVRNGGTIITLRPVDGPDLDRDIKTVFVNVRDRIADHSTITRLGQQVSSGILSLRVAGTFPAAEAAAAHQRLAEGGLRGRLVLDFEGLGPRS